jgi:hypothetical protein
MQSTPVRWITAKAADDDFPGEGSGHRASGHASLLLAYKRLRST